MCSRLCTVDTGGANGNGGKIVMSALRLDDSNSIVAVIENVLSFSASCVRASPFSDRAWAVSQGSSLAVVDTDTRADSFAALSEQLRLDFDDDDEVAGEITITIMMMMMMMQVSTSSRH